MSTTYTPYSDVYGESRNNDSRLPTLRHDRDDRYRYQGEDPYTAWQRDAHALDRSRQRREREHHHRRVERMEREGSLDDYSRRDSSFSSQDPRQRPQYRRSRSSDADMRQPQQSKRDRVDRVLHSFDYKSVDGFITAAAGAGIGAITARNFGKNDNPYKCSERKQVEWKTVGGAVIGALAGNAAFGKLKNKLGDKEDEQKQKEISEGRETSSDRE